MSRVGIQPIPLPAEVSVEIGGGNVSVTGPKGTLTWTYHSDMGIKQQDGVLVVERPSEERLHRALHGLTRTLLANMVIGVTEGFAKSLELVGVGYRVRENGPGLTLSVMLSHTVDVMPRPGLTIEVEGNNLIHVRGTDKQAVGQTAAEIRSVRPPNVYTGKGIRYLGEQVRLKPGKSARRTV